MDRNQYKNKLKELQTQKSKFRSDFWKPQPGKNTIRILPPLPPNEMFFYEVMTHFVQGFGSNGKGRLFRVDDVDNPINDAVRQLSSRDDEDLRSLAKNSRLQTVYYYSILDLNNLEKGVQVWKSYSKVIFETLLGYICEPEFGDFTDAEEGRNILLYQDNSGQYPKYNIDLHPQTSELSAEFLDERVDLSSFMETASNDELLGAAKFLLTGESQDDEEDEQVIRRTPPPRGKDKLSALKARIQHRTNKRH
jgi:hypothetical protein